MACSDSCEGQCCKMTDEQVRAAAQARLLSKPMEDCLVGGGRCNHESCAVYWKRKGKEEGLPWESFDAFGEWCDSVWMGKHPMEERDLIIATMGICGEAGEVSEKVKKELRDGTNAIEAGILKELGDVVHYACTIARFYGYKPSDILKANYDKLEDRIARGTQRGSGDSR